MSNDSFSQPWVSGDQRPHSSARATVPAFAVFCGGGRWRRPGWNPGPQERHGRSVTHSNRVNSLDDHLHVVSYRARLAWSLDDLQERKALSRQNSWSAKAARSITGSDLRGKRGGREGLYLTCFQIWSISINGEVDMQKMTLSVWSFDVWLHIIRWRADFGKLGWAKTKQFTYCSIMLNNH